MIKQSLISVVIPVYYEEDVVEECYKRLTNVMKTLKQYNYELIFINDGSKDRTKDILIDLINKDKNIKLIDFARNFGHQTAVSAGIFNASGDAIIVIDADLQDPPELIIDMIDKWNSGYDVVYAKRKKRNGESGFKLITAKYFYKVLSYMSEVDIPKDTGDFRLIDKRVADVFKRMPERNRFVRGMMSWIGFSQTFIEYERDERFAGQTKYPLKKMLKFASDGIISFSVKPLKLITKIGFITVIISFSILGYALISKLFGQDTVKGWTSLIVTLTFFSGIQLLSVGILGEYVARIFEESKDRPLYIINEMVNFNERIGDKIEND